MIDGAWVVCLLGFKQCIKMLRGRHNRGRFESVLRRLDAFTIYQFKLFNWRISVNISLA
jgi:hypothetical protein